MRAQAMGTVKKLGAAIVVLGLLAPACTASQEDVVAGSDALQEGPESSPAAVVFARADDPAVTLRLSTVLDDGANLAVLEAGEGPEALTLRCALVTSTANASVMLGCFDRAHGDGDSLSIVIGANGGRLELTCPDGKTTHAAFFATCDASHRLLDVESSAIHSPADVNHDPLELTRRIFAATAALVGLPIEPSDGNAGVVASIDARYGDFPAAAPIHGHGVKLTATLTDGRTVDGLDEVDFRTTGGTDIASIDDLTSRMRLVLPHAAP